MCGARRLVLIVPLTFFSSAFLPCSSNGDTISGLWYGSASLSQTVYVDGEITSGFEEQGLGNLTVDYDLGTQVFQMTIALDSGNTESMSGIVSPDPFGVYYAAGSLYEGASVGDYDLEYQYIAPDGVIAVYGTDFPPMLSPLSY